ncbi:MAG TPA: DUF192 domain-containing protein [Gemmatimonadaceae bacterium]|nr:DUF192 domain-containing protein [Gemmatimonadaceae bacterium]
MTTAVQTAYVIFQDGEWVTADVADTDEARARGLMFRAALAEHEGMLFTFAVPRRYGFWMKRVRMPLDIVWLDERRRIVWIVESAPPCEADPCPMYLPGAKASFVVELAGGYVARHGVALGDTVTISQLP